MYKKNAVFVNRRTGVINSKYQIFRLCAAILFVIFAVFIRIYECYASDCLLVVNKQGIRFKQNIVMQNYILSLDVTAKIDLNRVSKHEYK